jgi:hypothetical protein
MIDSVAKVTTRGMTSSGPDCLRTVDVCVCVCVCVIIIKACHNNNDDEDNEKGNHNITDPNNNI